MYRALVCLHELITEAATGGVLWKKVFLEISQNSQETPVKKSFFSVVLLK